MIKFNRTTEYGLMALKYMSRKRNAQAGQASPELPCEVTSAREISDFCGIPFEITAKTLQRLKDSGLIQSAQGSRGGYTLQRPLEEVTLAEFLELMEGPHSIVPCSSALAMPVLQQQASQSGATTHGPCEYSPRCELKHMMGGLNERFVSFLSGIRLAEIT